MKRFLGCCLLIAAAAFAQTPQELFQKALVKERSEGNLKEAIQLYRRAAEAAGKDRALAAKALVEAGECYRKLGDAEARELFERVVREYGDQKEAVELARAGLQGGGNAAARGGIVTRQIWANAMDNEGAPSPDGRYLSFVDWITGDLAIRDLATGKDRRLTNKGSWEQSEEFALFSIFSPDGKQIAYSWFNGGKNSDWDIRVVSVEEPGIPKARVLYHHNDVEDVLPFDWSRDGKEILVLLSKSDHTHQIALLSAANGSLTVLKTLDWRTPNKLSLSPDGRYVAYDFPPKEDSPRRDIYVLAVDGSRESAVVAHPSNDLAPVWTPDGRRIVFLSDRSGSMGVWILFVADGRAQGSPELLKADVGQMGPMAFTRKGSLFYSLQIGNIEVYTASLDVAAGRLREAKSITEPFSGANMFPDWSPDGRFLAYTSRVGVAQEPGSIVICIRTADTGEQRILRPDLSYLQSVHWSPDGRSLVTWGRDPKGRRGIFQIDAATGAVTPIVATGEDLRFAVWSPDGKSLFYCDVRKGRILVRNRETGEEKDLVPPGRFNVGRLALSPDGRQLAMTISHPEKKGEAIAVMPAGGGEPREIFALSSSPRVFEWTPDSRHLIFTREHSASAGLWRIPAEGGECVAASQAVGLPMVRGLRFHPDGRRVAFHAGDMKAEIWVMEDFLPPLKGKS